MSAAETGIIFNILVMPKTGAHYVKAGQKTMRAAPEVAAVIDLAWEGHALRVKVDHVYTPPGCDEHCIATLFLSEV